MNNNRYIATMVGLLLMLGASTTAYGQIVKGKVFGGGQLAQVNGGTAETACNVTINSGSVYGQVYGAGEGVKKDDTSFAEDDRPNVAKVTGDTRVTLGTGRGGGGTAWQDVFGGGALAKVDGDTYVTMSGGHIAANLFGGGMGDIKRTGGSLDITSADVTGNTNVDITGGDIIWNRTSLTSSSSSTVYTYTYTKQTTVDDEEITLTQVFVGVAPSNRDELIHDGYTESVTSEEKALAKGDIVHWDTEQSSDYVDAEHKIHNDLFYDDATKRFKIKHNIFGGGYVACRVGTYDNTGALLTKKDAENNDVPTGVARVSMVSGLFGADLMGTEQWKEAYNDNQDPHFYVFGGGYGAYTSVGMTEVQVGVNEEIIGAAGETDEQWAKPGMAGIEMLRSKANGNDHEIGIADNSYGEPGYTVLGVLGGGYAGIVTGNTDVRVGGNTFMHRIYGGGYGQLAAYNELTATDKIYRVGTSGTEYNREDLGMVMGNTYVKTDGGFVQGDVFGGGAGVESAWLDGSVYKELDNTHNTAAKDFTMGEVKGATEVEIGGSTFVLRSVYGGGDVANVLGSTVDTDPAKVAPRQTSTVTVKSGTVIQNVFGGGSGRLVTAVKAVDNNAVTVGKIVGNTLVTIENTTDEETGEFVSAPIIYGGIYGGGAYGQVVKTSKATDGNTVVLINGGKIGGDIFGGGLGKVDGSNITSANIAGNTTVTVNGGSYLWDVVVDANGNEKSWDNYIDSFGKEVNYKNVTINKTIAEALANPAEYLEKAKSLFDSRELLFKNAATGEYTDHNIYGGGNTACMSGEASVTINHGMFDDNLGYFADDNTCTPGGLLRFIIHSNKQHPQFSILGGGYGPNTTVASTNVVLQMGKDDVAGYDNTSDNAVYDAFMQKMQDDFDALGEEKQNELYGGTSGPNVQNRYVTSRLAWSYGIPNHSVLTVAGGGMAGYVTGNTNVTLSDHAEAVLVFGGGIGLEPQPNETATGTETYGQVGGNTAVTVSGGVVSNNIYGGGAGIESVKVNGGGVVLSKDDNTDGTAHYVDFVDIARVLGTTSVTISGSTPETLVYGAVYGGGDVANVGVTVAGTTFAGDKVETKVGVAQRYILADGTVNTAYTTPQSTVTVSGGCVFGEIFGGGSGRTIDMCSVNEKVNEDESLIVNNKYGYKNVGAVYGNSRVIIKDPDVNPTNATKPWIWSRIYGGGSYGKIYGNTDVQIQGGNIGYDVYGAGVGMVASKVVDEAEVPVLTSADVTGNANVTVSGGEYCLSQMWNTTTRAWYPTNKKAGNTYSAQYDPEQKKFIINHNVYGGSYNCGRVLGSTYINMSKGLISGTAALGHDYDTSSGKAFFTQNEWKEMYEKIGSPHFSVFGAGYGENTVVANNTNVNINFNFTGAVDFDATAIDAAVAASKGDAGEQTYTLFESFQSLMDVIGGGYAGKVLGSTNVDIAGKTFMRRAFGGSFYASVGETNINVQSVSADDIFGGGMMGDVTGSVNLNVGIPAADNDKIFINNNVFGGNDVSGIVSGQITANIYGGKIYNNVYGAGNGNYLYAINQDVDVVTTHENYESNGQTYELVYEVPLRKEMDFSLITATDAVKIVNINTYRPNAQKVQLNLFGKQGKPLTIKGNVFGGGNTATVNNIDGDAEHTSVEVNIGSYCNIGGVFMGDDGDAMFQQENGFMDAFQKINGVDLAKEIKWNDNPIDKIISELYLPVKPDDRPKIYPHVLDLYFQPVEMSLQPTLNWKGTIDADGNVDDDFKGTTIGTFVCGGNRGNMNVSPAANGSIVDYSFPAGLTITNRIVGGCNNANYTLGKTVHVGGYLLGSRGTEDPAINLDVQCQFGLADGVTLLDGGDAIVKDAEGNNMEQRNVYGGCYSSGTIRGDINIDFRSSMLNVNNVGAVKTKEAVDKIAKTYFGSEVAMGNVYGAGYGSESYVYGNTKVTVNPLPVTVSSAKGSKPLDGPDPVVDDNAYAAMSVYGGGQQGNVIGNTTVRVLNGHIGKSVVGGSYAGYMWGNTQVLVGYPTYYVAKKGGRYKMARADKWNTAVVNHDGSNVVKDEIYVLPGDIISQEVYEAIKDYDAHNTHGAQANSTNFDEVTETPSGSWDNIKITIDEACYGGGYSLASGSSVAAGTYTVKKYDETMNVTDAYSLTDLKAFVNHTDNTSTKGYGGNTTVLVWDNNAAETNNDHIHISTQTMTEVHLPEGTDLFGYYVIDNEGHTTYLHLEDTYFYGTDTDKSDGKTYYQRVWESDSEGGMYGDGHLSFAEGFRAGELVGYGFAGSEPNGSKIINTFQRMDMLRIKDCAVSVLGARDYTVNEISKTPYSVARIGELQMVAENVTNFKSGGNLASAKTPKSRNYLGLSNNIHYLGAVKSNVDFTSKYHYGCKDATDNPIGTEIETSYRETKQKYINDFNTEGNTYFQNAAEFQKRNDGTAANMIGISSGYALKVLNVNTVGNASTEQTFYGPIVGVVEMNLIDVREDEGGGYVYADNIHHRNEAISDFSYSSANYDQVPSAHKQDEDFLEVSGNFVFPYDEKKNRYIVDDCFPTGFSGEEATAEGHYWYVTGYNYYYNAHITGYTYNSSGSKPLTFHSDKDALLTLSGAKKGQLVKLQSLKWRSNHIANKDGDGFVASDIETTGTAMATACAGITATDVVRKGSGNTASSSDGEHYIYNNYNLFVGTANNDGKYGTTVKVKPAVGTDLTYGYYTDEACETAATGTADGNTEYYQKLSYWNNLPTTEGLGSGTSRTLINQLATDDPILTFQLVDQVDNSGIDYYKKYMQQPCEATIVLTAQDVDGAGHPKKGYVPISDFFTKESTTYRRVADGTPLDATTYYYFGNGNDYHEVTTANLYYYNKEQSRYVPIVGDDEVTGGTETQRHPKGPALTEEQMKAGAMTLYAFTDRVFTYTIYLTIDYVQGPDVSGNLKVYNCALPGEKIKIDKGTIDIKSDISMSQTAAIWRIFKNGTTDNAKYVFDQANPYDEKKATANVTSEMLKDVEYSEADNCIYVPAYYFMNGYNVEYCYRVNGIDQLFTAPAGDNDFLTIHNYHRMLPRAANGRDKVEAEMHLDLAAQRAAEDAAAVEAGTLNAKDALAEPRIYIADAMDLNEFSRFLEEKVVTGKDGEGNPVYGNKYDYGNHMQFHLLNDITVKSEQEDHYVAPTGFKGTLNGNGYVISGLGTKSGDHTAPLYLFDTTTAANYQQQGGAVAYNIYNLGLKQGYISTADRTADKDVTGNPNYHCLYTWANKAVYRANGTVDKTYTDNDFRYGRVTYDLNQYYLDHRTGPAAVTNVDGVLAKGKAPGLSVGEYESYVHGLYRNGDYLYARWQTASPEYLRTSASQYDANYLSHTSYHRFSLVDGVLTHPVDVSRAVGYQPATVSQPASCDHYAPLFEEAKHSDNVDADIIRNDYIFFGQQLNSGTKTASLGEVNATLPEHIDAAATHEVARMDNRVYRACGYYASENAYSTSGGAFFHNADAYVHDNGITAIDFHGYDDTTITWYAPAVDYRLTDLNSADGVTRNLLVYADNADDVAASTHETPAGVLHKYVYAEATAEANVKMHIITPKAVQSGTVKAETALLHLVERATEDAPNNDFSAPIAFDVTQRAWYTRQPKYYASSNDNSWEGIALPFTAKKVEASLNGEITHFYGTPDDAQLANPETNDKTLHHEYWLRGLTAVANDNGTVKATFQRPGVFNPAGAAEFDYHFENTWFTEAYPNYSTYSNANGKNNWYSTAHDYADYLPLTADIPYIVSFPGERYYEFDLSSKFYNEKTNSSEHGQTVTFSHDGKTTIAVTAVKKVSANGYDNVPTYLYKSDARYGMNADGTAFVNDNDYRKILPFRTYLAEGSSAKPSRHDVIYISGDVENIIDSRAAEHDGPSEEIDDKAMKAYAVRRNIIIESGYDADVIIYSASGQLVRAVRVLEGNNVYTGFAPGVYLVNGTKLVVR